MNPNPKHILFATDFSDCSAHAFQYAVSLARTYNSKLDLVHVLELQPGMDEGSDVARIYLEERRKDSAQEFDQLMEQARSRVEVAASHQVAGLPAGQINRTASELRADLIVLGTHGRTGLDRVLLGSTAEQVVRQAPCPVLTVRRPEGVKASRVGEDRSLFRSILVPVDFSECSLEAFEYAAMMAMHFNATVLVLHVEEPVSYGLDFTLVYPSKAKKSRESWESRLSELTATLQSRGIKAQPTLQGGLPSDVILQQAMELRPDLIVMGTHGRRGFSRVLMGSVAEAVLRRAPCPVLTIKSAPIPGKEPSMSWAPA